MRTLLVLTLMASGLFGGYKAYQLYLENQRLNSLLGTEKKLEKKLETELTARRAADIENQKKLVAKLRADLERQRQIVSELDGRLNGIAAKSSNGMIALQLKDELGNQQQRVTTLEQEVRDYRSAISGQNAQLQAVKGQSNYARQAGIATTNVAIRQQQDQLRGIRDQLRNLRRFQLTPDEVRGLQTRLQTGQENLALLRSQLSAQTGYANGLHNEETQINSGITQSRTGLKQLEDQLTVEKRQLNSLQDEFRRQDKSELENLKGRDRLQNQFYAEKTKLDRMTEDFGRQTTKLERMN